MEEGDNEADKERQEGGARTRCTSPPSAINGQSARFAIVQGLGGPFAIRVSTLVARVAI
jgi:hypothetical protein